MFLFRKSLGFRIFALSVILLSFPLLVDSFILLNRERLTAIELAKNDLIEIANLREIALSDIEPINLDFLKIVISDLQLEKKFPEKPDASLTQSLIDWSKMGEVYGIFVVAIQGGEQKIVGSSVPNLLGKELNSFMITKKLNLEDDFRSQVAFDRQSTTPFFFITKNIKDAQTSEIKGFLLVTDIMYLTAKLENLLQAEKGLFPVNFAFLEENNFVIASSDPELSLQYFQPLKTEKIKEIISKHFFEIEKFDLSQLPKQPIELVPNEADPPLFAFKWRDRTQIGFLKTIPDSKYSLLAYATKDEILTNPMENYFDVYGTYLAILLIGITLSLLFVKRMTKPISDLAQVMQEIQEGNIDARYKKDLFGFEINALGVIFNNMLNSLIENQSKAVQERVKKEAYLKEMKLGQQAQLSLLPQKMPKIRGVEIAERYIPAIEVGGDFYDVFIINKNGEEFIYLIVADASGKGVQACFYSLSARSMLRMYAQYFDGIQDVMHATNALFCNDVGDTGMFITVGACIYHPKSRELEYYFSGHNPGLIRRKKGTIETLELQDIAMGLVAEGTGKAKKVKLEKGDLFLLYTDGVTEAHDKEQKLFGEARLKEFLLTHDIPAHDLLDLLVEEVNAFASGRLQHDDITLLAMKIEEGND